MPVPRMPWRRDPSRAGVCHVCGSVVQSNAGSGDSGVLLALQRRERRRLSPQVQLLGVKDESCNLHRAHPRWAGLRGVWVQCVLEFHSCAFANGVGGPVFYSIVSVALRILCWWDSSARRSAVVGEPLRPTRNYPAGTGDLQYFVVSLAFGSYGRICGGGRGDFVGNFVLSLSSEFRESICAKGGVAEPNGTSVVFRAPTSAASGRPQKADPTKKNLKPDRYCWGEGSGRFLRTGFSPEAGAGSALPGFAGSVVAGVATSSPPPSE